MDISNHLTKLWDAINYLHARARRKRPVSNDDFLYRRVHPTQVKKDGTVSTAAFTDPELSVDIASLSSAEKSLRRAKSDEYGLAKLAVKEVRAVTVAQEVLHWPVILNYSHALVKGKKTTSAKKQLAQVANNAGWEIKPKSLMVANSLASTMQS